jgi:hypothetical protein
MSRSLEESFNEIAQIAIVVDEHDEAFSLVVRLLLVACEARTTHGASFITEPSVYETLISASSYQSGDREKGRGKKDAIVGRNWETGTKRSPQRRRGRKATQRTQARLKLKSR